VARNGPLARSLAAGSSAAPRRVGFSPSAACACAGSPRPHAPRGNAQPDAPRRARFPCAPILHSSRF
jgi:hypothetical protein